MAFDGGAVTLTVTEAAGVLGISRGLAYSCANRFIESEGAEGLPVVRLGRRLVVPMHQLQRLLSGERSLVAHGTTVSEVPPPDRRPEVANNDGVVDCTDVNIVRGAFGKRVGELGYLANADLNGDNVVNLRDLSMLTQMLSARTYCQ